MMNSLKYILILFIGILISFLSLKSCEAERRKSFYRQNIKSYSDSLYVLKNINGKQEGRIKVLSVTKKELKAALDGVIVNKNTVLASMLSTESKIRVSGKTSILRPPIVEEGQIKIRSPTNLSPVFTSLIKHQWFTADITCSSDSVHLELEYKEKNLVSIEQRRSLLRSNPITFMVSPQNPHTSIRSVKSYEVKNRGPILVVAATIGPTYNILEKRLSPLGVTLGVGIKLVR